MDPKFARKRRRVSLDRPAWAVGLVAAALCGWAYKPALAAPPDGPTAETVLLAEALRDADSDFLGVRETAVKSLRRLPASSRLTIREAFRSGNERRRATLASVLAERPDREDIRLLLDTLTTARDPATASALRQALIDNAEETSALVAEFRAAQDALALSTSPAATPPEATSAEATSPTANVPKATPSNAPATRGVHSTPLAELEDLLARARLEAIFISRKSTSGGTGSYDGQYAEMRYDRKRALKLCISILADEDEPRPGVFPIGSFRFLRAPSILISQEEIQSMAANAVLELITKADAEALDRLEAIHRTLERIALQPQRPQIRVKQLMALALDDVILPTLFLMGRADRDDVDRHVTFHANQYDFDDAAHLLLRLKEYEEAIGYFRRQLQQLERKVIPCYNLACAYARWSIEPGIADEAKAQYRAFAVSYLERSVAFGYPDWPWMEQDRDLEAIRKDPTFVKLVAALKKKYPPIEPTFPRPPK